MQDHQAQVHQQNLDSQDHFGPGHHLYLLKNPDLLLNLMLYVDLMLDLDLVVHHLKIRTTVKCAEIPTGTVLHAESLK